MAGLSVSESIGGVLPGVRALADYRRRELLSAGFTDCDAFDAACADTPAAGGVLIVAPGVYHWPRTPSWGNARNLEVVVLPGVQLVGGGAWPAPVNGCWVRYERLGGSVLAYAARLRPSSPQSIPSGSYTPIAFADPRSQPDTFDSANFWRPNDPTRITAPADGIYSLAASLGFQPSDSGTVRELRVRVNGSGSLPLRLANGAPSATLPWLANASADWRLAAGDYLELLAYHDAALVSGASHALDVLRLNVDALSAGVSEPVGLETLAGGTDVPLLSIHYVGALD